MTEIDLATLDVVAYLSGKGVQVYPAAGDEVTVHCMFCTDGDPKGKGRLYCNTVEGLWGCKRCGEVGNVRSLLKHFGDTVSGKTEAPRANRRAILEMAVSLGEQMLMANDDMIDYLLGPERGLTAETVMNARLGFVPKGWSLSGSMAGFSRADLVEVGLLTQHGRDFYENRLLIPYLSRGAVVSLRGREPGAKYFTAAGDTVRLYGADDLDGAEDVILTEGEMDRLVLRQHLARSTDPKIRKIAVVGLPGTQALPQSFESYFANARRVYVGFDPDTAGKLGAEKIRAKLGAKAKVLELPDDLPKCDWSEWFKRGNTWKQVADLLSEVSDRRLMTVAESGRKWRTQRATTPGMKFGYLLLDQTIKPGLLPGQVVVVLATTGTGKTVFTLNLAYNNRGHKHLLVSLEMTAEECYERLRRIHLFYHPYATDDEIDWEYRNLMICDENRLNGKDIEALIGEFEEEMGARPVFCTVDYLGYFARGAAGSGQYEKTSEAIMLLKAIGKANKVIMVVPHQVSRSGKDGKPLSASDARDSGVVEETADFLLTIYRPDDSLALIQDKSGRIIIGLEKSRHGGKGKTFNLLMAAQSLAIVEPSTKAGRDAQNENYLVNERGMDYAAVRAERIKPVQSVIVYGQKASA
jgi:archaellum biogenesis ATPase FlaH